MEVNQWLLANRPPRSFGRFSYDHDLEVEVGDLLARELERRRLKRLMRTCLVTIERGQIYQFPLRKRPVDTIIRSEEHTSELQSLMRLSYAVFCLKKKKQKQTN